MKIPYEVVTYPEDCHGEELLSYVPLGSGQIFKTIVLKGERKGIMVVMVPLLEEIDFKKLARAVDDKKIALLPLAELLSVTGYVRGGCSPVGMKKSFPAYIDRSVRDFERVSVSAGQRGMQMILGVDDLLSATRAQVIDVVSRGM